MMDMMAKDRKIEAVGWEMGKVVELAVQAVQVAWAWGG